jgi:hypothetical protein
MERCFCRSHPSDGGGEQPSLRVPRRQHFLARGIYSSAAPNTAYGANEAYRAANSDDRVYLTSGTMRLDGVTVTGVPEPSTFLALMGGAATLLGLRRRRA